jgi:hypothetical protein
LHEGFDAVRFMRERRTEIDEEDAGLSLEERSRKTTVLLAGAILWQRLRNQLVQAQSRVLPPASTPKR